VFRHAKGQQPPLQPLTALVELHSLASENHRCFELRLVGGCPDTARPGRTVGRARIVGVLGERENPVPGSGELLLLFEPCL
jgi:hypothetical protein